MLPSAGLYLERLQDLQIAFFLGVIRGDRDVEEFDDFVKDWRHSGGDVLLEEAREMYRVKQEIFREVGVNPRVSPAERLRLTQQADRPNCVETIVCAQHGRGPNGVQVPCAKNNEREHQQKPRA